MARVGVISDTHGYLDPQIIRLFHGVDHIVHAGDIGPEEILKPLEQIAPVTAVLGNTDSFLPFPHSSQLKIESRSIFIQHIVHPASDSHKFSSKGWDIVVFGHTHQRFNQVMNGVQLLNPGYSGRSRPGTPRSVALLHVSPSSLDVQFLELE